MLEITKNKMKKYLLLIEIAFSLCCLSQNSNNINIVEVDDYFKSYINTFTELKLPMGINKLDDFDKYSDVVLEKIKGETAVVENTLCPKILKKDYKYLSDKYPTGKNYTYQSVYKKKWNGLFLLIIVQSNNQTGDYFLFLNTCMPSGVIVDTLRLAGQKINDYDRFCTIDSNFTINIRTLKYLTDNNNGGTNGFETIEEYLIKDDGHFSRIRFLKEKAVFSILNDEVIRIDKTKKMN